MVAPVVQKDVGELGDDAIAECDGAVHARFGTGWSKGRECCIGALRRRFRCERLTLAGRGARSVEDAHGDVSSGDGDIGAAVFGADAHGDERFDAGLGTDGAFGCERSGVVDDG